MLRNLPTNHNSPNSSIHPMRLNTTRLQSAAYCSPTLATKERLKYSKRTTNHGQSHPTSLRSKKTVIIIEVCVKKMKCIIKKLAKYLVSKISLLLLYQIFKNEKIYCFHRGSNCENISNKISKTIYYPIPLLKNAPSIPKKTKRIKSTTSKKFKVNKKTYIHCRKNPIMSLRTILPVYYKLLTTKIII